MNTETTHPVTFSPTTFEEALAIFRASRPGEELHEGDGPVGSVRAFSFAPFEESPDPGPESLLSEHEQTAELARLTKKPQALVKAAVTESAITAWNASGDGKWAASPGKWIIADVELAHESDMEEATSEEEADAMLVKVIFAAWSLKGGGFAMGIWKREEKALLAKVMGLSAWPTTSWGKCNVWYGE